MSALLQWFYGLLMLAGIPVSGLLIYIGVRQTWAVYPNFNPGDAAYLGGGIAFFTWLTGRLWDWHEKRRTAAACLEIRFMADANGWIAWEDYQTLLKRYGTTIAEQAIARVGAKIGARKTATLSAVS